MVINIFYLIQGESLDSNTNEVSLSCNPEDIVPLKYTTNLVNDADTGIVAEEGLLLINYLFIRLFI